MKIDANWFAMTSTMYAESVDTLDPSVPYHWDPHDEFTLNVYAAPEEDEDDDDDGDADASPETGAAEEEPSTVMLQCTRPTCVYMAPSDRALWLHEMFHKLDGDKLWTCRGDGCGHITPIKRDWSHHMAKCPFVSDALKYTCLRCGLKTMKARALRTHLDGVKICAECAFSTNCNRELNRHVRSEHPRPLRKTKKKRSKSKSGKIE